MLNPCSWPKRAAVSLLFLFGVSSVTACSLIGLQHEVKFHANDSSLGKSEAVALARWFVHQRDIRPNDEVDIVSMYPAGNKMLEQISQGRMQNIAKIITALNTDEIKVVLNSGEGQQDATGPLGYVYDEVLVVMAPSCSRTGTCCGITVT